MTTGVELANAWVRLTPSIEGIQEQITKEFGGAGKAAEGEGKKAGGLFGGGMKKALIGAAVVGGVVAAFKGLYEVGSTFDNVTDTIRVGTGAQGEALEGLVGVAKSVGTSVPAEFEKVGSTVADLNTRMGLSGETLEMVSKQYLEAGRILGEDVDIASTSAAFSAFKIEGDDVSGAMDTLFQVSQATGVGMNELASGVQTVAPALQTLGFSFEDSISLLGTMDKAGLNSEAMLASMSKGMVTLAKDGEEPQAAFERVSAEIQGFVDTGDKAAALDLASQVFGTRGAADFVGALESGVVNMDDLMGATGATGDTILGVGEETMSFAEKWQITMNKATEAIEPLATAIFEGLSKGLDAIMPTLSNIGDWAKNNMGTLGIVAGVIGGALVIAFAAWTVGIIANTVAMLASPVTWIILGIIALIAAIVLLVMNWDMVVSFIKDVWGGFIGWIMDGLNGFVGWWNGLWTGVWEFIVGIWDGIVAWVTAGFTGLFVFLVGVGAGISSWWTGLWSGIGSFFAGIWDGIIGAVQNVGSIFGGVFSAVADVVKNAFSGVVSIIKNVINGIIDAVNGVIGGINGVAGVIGGAIGVELKVGKIPKLAQGATVLPQDGGTLAILAEAGRPETVVDTGKINALIDSILMGQAGWDGSGTRVVQNNNYAPGLSESDVARLSTEKLNYALRSA